MNAVVGELGWPSYREVEVDRWRTHECARVTDSVAEETPVVVVYNDVPHVVMLATPLDLEDFAIGFSLTEGIVESPGQIQGVRAVTRAEGIELRVRLADERRLLLAEQQRNLTGRTGCGLCGATSLKQVFRHPPPVVSTLVVDAAELHDAFTALRERQTLNALTGAVHAAAWALPGRGVQIVREDVGRHNALDKLIGALVRRRLPHGDGFIIVTSRASYEMVQKCAMTGVAMLAAISAPTGLAIRLADESALTLIGFARDRNHVVYSHPERLTGRSDAAREP